MAVQFNPKDYAHLLTQMVAYTKAYQFFKDPDQVYFVLQGPKIWMDTFIHFNKRRPVVYLQYGPNPSNPSVACFLSNVSDSDIKNFVLNLHTYENGALLDTNGRPLKKKAGKKVLSFNFRAPDTRVDQYSNEECHFEGADTDITKDIVKTMESH